MARAEEGYVASFDGTRLYTRTWWPEESPRAGVVLVHGAGEHCGRYEYVSSRLCGAGVAVFGFDLRGHGRSAGRRGHVQSFDEYVGDVHTITQRAAAALPGRPLFMYGHSMGGLVATLAAAGDQAPYRGLVLTSPLFAPAISIPAFMRAAAVVLNTVYPVAGIRSGIPSLYLSHDVEVGRAYDADPLVSHTVTPRWFFAMNRACAAAANMAAGIRLPVLLLQAGDDHLVSARQSRVVFDLFGAADKEFHIFDGLYHELHNEPDKDAILDLVINWLASRIRGE